MFTWTRCGIREGNQAQQPRYFPGSSAAHVLSLNFRMMELQTAPEEFGTQAVARLLSSHSQSRQPESPKSLEEVELR